MNEKTKKILKIAGQVAFDIIVLGATICLFKYLSWPLLIIVLVMFISYFIFGLTAGVLWNPIEKYLDNATFVEIEEAEEAKTEKEPVEEEKKKVKKTVKTSKKTAKA